MFRIFIYLYRNFDAKSLERLIYQDVYSNLRCSFTDVRHGFLRKRSTTSNLIVANEFISESMDNGGQVDVVYIDYRKCFDEVLLSKLNFSGLHYNLLRWFTSHVENCSQAVTVRGYVSRWTDIPSGVPQGSIQGPLLFVIFIMDISKCFLNSKILLFADDVKIVKANAAHELQHDLLRFEQYCLINKLDLNVEKCHCTTFTRKVNEIK
jgi:ribonucleases P/MRP protein subunit RPP40